MAGLVWNPPTSCAWAARVYVNNREARDHGVHHVGLPSRLADFKLLPGEVAGPEAAAGASAAPTAASPVSSAAKGKHSRSKPCCASAAALSASWWQPAWPGAAAASAEDGAGGGARRAAAPVLELRNVDTGRGRALSVPVCRISLPGAERPLGPRITLSLPSFSGATPEVPGLLRYACDLRTHIGLMPPLQLSAPEPGRGEEGSAECLAGVLRGRPLVALEFAQMEMHVEAPEELVIASMEQKAAQSPRWAAARAACVTTAWAARGA